MKTMAIKSYGPVDQLQWNDIPEPTPGNHEVRVRVRATSVNQADSKVITGKVKMLHARNFPMVVGYDFAGEIDALGSDVREFKIGDRVFGFLPYGGKNRQGAFGEKVVAKVNAISLIPASLSFEQAGVVPTAALTALQGLRTAIAQAPGKKVLINGASGGVGSFAVQIASILGTTVTAISSSGSADFVRALGAKEVIDYKKTSLNEINDRYSVIFDVASNLSFFKARHLLEAGGRFLSLLPSASVIGGILLRPVMKEKCSFVMVKCVDRDLQEVAQWIEQNRLKTPIEKTYSLENVVQAIHHLDKGGVKGKIAITI